MAKARLDLLQSKSIPLATKGWVNFKNQVGAEFLKLALDPKSVYIIRLSSPFAVMYPNNPSPVTYIGSGNFQKRITSHLKDWLNRLDKGLSGAFFEVLVSKPRAQKKTSFYRDVEADLIEFFYEEFGSRPLNNVQRNSHPRSHQYDPKEMKIAFGIGKGNRYLWGITPIGSNKLKSKVGK